MSRQFASYPRSVSVLFATLLSVVLSLVPAACAQPQTNSSGAPVAFVGVNVVPMDREGVLENHTVIVRDGKIASVAPAGEAEVPADARQIDGNGRWLMPGLAEMHGHVPGPDDPAYVENVLFLYVANGVTTVRNMAGNPSHLALRDRIVEGAVTGPTLHAASPWLDSKVAGTPEQARQAVRDHKAAEYDLIKIGSIPRPAYLAMAETAQAADMPFGGHIPADVGLTGALDARQTSIDHFDRYVEFLIPPGTDTRGDGGFFGSGWIHLVEPARIPLAVKRTIAAGTWNVPTLSLVEHLASDEPAETMIARPEMRYMPKEVRDGWVRAKRDFDKDPDFEPAAARKLVTLRRTLLNELHQAGAPIALGSDAPQFFNVPGFSIHHEMRMMAAAGLSPHEVLATGTSEAARYFDAAETFGTVAAGRRADLILLDANPLDDLANVQRRVGVMVRGQWLPEAEIQARLEKIAAHVAER